MTNRSLRHLLLLPCLAAASSLPATSAFVGDWKLDPARSTLPDRFQVRSEGGDRYTFNFAGTPETIVVNGTDQVTPVDPTGTLAVGKDGDTWKVVRKAGGRTTLTAVWRLSGDSSALSDHFQGFNADGSPYTLDYVYKRSAPGSGFTGAWVSSSLHALNYVIEIQIRPYQGGGLSLVDTAARFTGNLQFAADMLRPVNDRTVDLLRRKANGGLSPLRLQLSADMKTLTVTPRKAPRGDQYIFVFDRR